MSKAATSKEANTTLFLKELEPDGLQNIRDRLSKEMNLIIDKKVHPMAGGLMEVLCAPEMISHLSVEQLISMIESIFPHYVVEEGWMIKYCDMLLRTIDEAKRSNPKPRAKRYEDHLRGVLIPMLRDKAHTGTIDDDKDLMEDIYKVTVCLYRHYTKREKEFSFLADRESMDSLNKALMKVTSVGNQVLGISFASVKSEERQYATFLSWILEELLVKLETPKEGVELWA